MLYHGIFFTTELIIECYKVNNVIKLSKEQKHNKIHISDLWTAMWRSYNGNLVCWLWEDQAEFFPAALATTEKAIKAFIKKPQWVGQFIQRPGKRNIINIWHCFMEKPLDFIPWRLKWPRAINYRAQKLCAFIILEGGLLLSFSLHIIF